MTTNQEAQVTQADDPLDAWAFNVALECMGRSEDRIDLVIGGDVLNLRDLHIILQNATRPTSDVEALRGALAMTIAEMSRASGRLEIIAGCNEDRRIASALSRTCDFARTAIVSVSGGEERCSRERAEGRDEGVITAIECISMAAEKHPGTPMAKCATFLANCLQDMRADDEWADTLYAPTPPISRGEG